MNKTARNAEYIKQYNRKKILSLLSRESLSRAELARRTGLTRSAISIITDELLGYQILMEHEAVAQKRAQSGSPVLKPGSFLFGRNLSEPPKLPDRSGGYLRKMPGNPDRAHISRRTGAGGS